jgi:hypothetical protein
VVTLSVADTEDKGQMLAAVRNRTMIRTMHVLIVFVRFMNASLETIQTVHNTQILLTNKSAFHVTVLLRLLTINLRASEK